MKIKTICFLLVTIFIFVANSEDSLLFNFELENALVSSSNLSCRVKVEKQKFLNIYIDTMHDITPVSINDIPLSGEAEFSITLQKRNNLPYLFIAQKESKLINQEYEQVKQWLFSLRFPKYCKKLNPILLVNGVTGNSAVTLLDSSVNYSTFLNTPRIPSIIFQISDTLEEVELPKEENFVDDQILYGISDKIIMPLKDPSFSSFFKEKKFSIEIILQWSPLQKLSNFTCQINNSYGLFHKIDNNTSALIWLDSSIPMVDKQTKKTNISIDGIKFIKEKTIFTIPYITINMQKLSGPSLYFGYPIPKGFCSYSPKINLSMQIVRFIVPN